MARYIKKFCSTEPDNQESWIVAQMGVKSNEAGEVNLKGFFVDIDTITPFDWGEFFLSDHELEQLNKPGDKSLYDLQEVDKSLYDEIEGLAKKHSEIIDKIWQLLC